MVYGCRDSLALGRHQSYLPWTELNGLDDLEGLRNANDPLDIRDYRRGVLR